MSTDQRTLPGSFSTDADFRNWGSGLSAQFAAVGLVKTSDTGQIDWSTVLKPSGGAQQRGYEVWRFNDALQATKPVFIRIDFGSSSSGSTLPGLWVNVGTATNGTGTLTGQVGTSRQVSSSSATSGVTYCSGNSSRLTLVSNVSSANTLIQVYVERTKTGAGVDTGDGIVRFFGGFGSYQFIPFVGPIPAEVSSNPALDSNSGGVSALGTDVMLSPTVVFYGKPLFASWCAYKNTDITGLTPITFTYLGAVRTYLPLGAIASNAQNNVNSTSGYSLALLWE
jgi:hypothetical protein